MNAAIAALEDELARAEHDLEKVHAETAAVIDDGQKAAAALAAARQVVAELKAAIATLTPTPHPDAVAEVQS